jgi:hypothetical protein
LEAATIFSGKPKDVMEKINLQRDGNKARTYQVRQVRNVVLKYNLGGII